MTQLWLNFTDNDGKDHRVLVEGEKFTIGRQSSCDLCIPDGRLSREHIRIERFGVVFVINDLGSSNGTKLNGTDLNQPEGLKNDDVIELGGGASLTIEMTGGAAQEPEQPKPEEDGAGNAPLAAAPAAANASASAGGSGGPPVWLLLIPVAGLVLLMFGGIVYLAVSDQGGARAQTDRLESDRMDSFDDLDTRRSQDSNPPATPERDRSETSTTDDPGPIETSTPTPTTNTSGGDTNGAPVANLSETEKIERFAAMFLRRIALNDPKAFITSDQAKRLAPKIQQISRNPALAANLNAAKKSSSQIASLAQSRNLRAQFLAIAAITRLGNSRGDPLQTSQSMVDVIDKLTVQLNNEFSDDALLVVAALEQGNAGDTRKLRDLLQRLANQYPESTRSIRTIWFLHQNKHLSDADFDRALTFLAIGAISQNPKEFGVNAEALAI
ncbi:MAG TPA: FHA domain-containing protein [Pyrinomonadaceae bacterium]|nr:FHA domain-containing protein [Pyrinomonadaceae bacterium]HMP64346.1 FHA domain-containing protein [Pyrinomonadaceae bacterium]